MIKPLSTLLLTLLVTACATSSLPPSISYYVLDESVIVRTTTDRNKQLQVSLLQMSSYLHQPNLILKDNNHKVNVANFHLWADPLDSSMKRAISNDLMLLNDELEVVRDCSDCISLKIWVDHFYPSTTGQVYLSGAYVLSNITVAPINRRFNLVGTQKRDGYASSVTEMRRLVTELAAQIASEL